MTRPLPLVPAILVAAAAGLLLDTAFPDKGWWFTAFPAIGLALIAMQGRRVGSAILVGLVFADLPMTHWVATVAFMIAVSALLSCAGLIMALTLLGMATALTGMVVVLPWLAHASWHAYRDLVEPPAA